MAENEQAHNIKWILLLLYFTFLVNFCEMSRFCDYITSCSLDYRARVCRRKYLALLAELRRQQQAQREREEHEEEERRRQQLEEERKRRLEVEQENLRKDCPLTSALKRLKTVMCVKVMSLCVCLQDQHLHPYPCRERKSRSPGLVRCWVASWKNHICRLYLGRAASFLRCDICSLFSEILHLDYEITSSTHQFKDSFCAKLHF